MPFHSIINFHKSTSMRNATHRIGSLTFLLLLLTTGGLYGQTGPFPADQDTIVIIADNEDPGKLERIINEDVVEGTTNRVNPDRVYKLEADGVYIMQSAILFGGDTDSTATLTIVGEEGGKRPMVLMSPQGGATSIQNIVDGSITLKNVFWPGTTIGGTGGGSLFTMRRGKQTLWLENFMSDLARGDLFNLRPIVEDPVNIYIKDCYFRNNMIWNNPFNFAVFARGDNGEPIDTLWISNTTVANAGLTFFGKFTPVKYTFFDHNTVINVAKYMLFSEQWEEAYFTNNLFVNVNWQGEDLFLIESQLAADDSQPNGLINLDTINDADWIARFGEAPAQEDVIFVNASNISYYSPFLDKYYNGEYNDVADHPVSYHPNGEVSEVLNTPPVYINTMTQGFADEFNQVVVADNYDNTLDPGLKTMSIPTQEVGDFYGYFAQSWYSNGQTLGTVPFNSATMAPQMAVVDLDATTFPGQGEAAGTSTGFEDYTDLEEDFSYTNAVRSEIDGLPIGSLVWWDGIEYDEEASMASIMDYYAELTPVEDFAVFADTYQLKAYPNPVVRNATIEFTLQQSHNVRVTIFDALGRGVRSLTNQEYGTGTHQLAWDTAPFPGGVYYYVVSVDGSSATGKLVVNR
jgi:hypothetical protein